MEEAFKRVLGLIIFFIFCFEISNYAQTSAVVFKNGDRVCFIGNSITFGGDFHHNISLYYATHFPSVKISFFNCGINGDVTKGILRRMDSDILIHKPTYAVIMIGMNDIGRGFYTKTSYRSKDTLAIQQASLQSYKRNLDSIVSQLLRKEVKVILQKPSIYDQTAALPSLNAFGANDALKVCGEFMEQIATKNNLSTVDYWSILSEVNSAIQRKDSTASIIGKDRVHPGASGSFIMAYQFLKTTLGSQGVSNIFIDAKNKKGQQGSSGCIINKLQIGKSSISFICKENSLPFPVREDQKGALDLVPFQKEFNQELLKVNNLQEGFYKVYIDTGYVGGFSGSELMEGVDLAQIISTPQYQQALKVRSALQAFWNAEGDLRKIKQVEYMELRSFTHKDDSISVRNFLDSIATTTYANQPFYNKQLEDYLRLKPTESDLKKEIDRLRENVYRFSRTRNHDFKIIKV